MVGMLFVVSNKKTIHQIVTEYTLDTGHLIFVRNLTKNEITHC